MSKYTVIVLSFIFSIHLLGAQPLPNLPKIARPEAFAPFKVPDKLITLKIVDTQRAVDLITKSIEDAGYSRVTVDNQTCVIEGRRELPAAGRTERREEILVWYFRDAVTPETYFYVFAMIARFSNPMGVPMSRYTLKEAEER